MKILNLYAGIGGNRKLWPEGHEITAVEIDPKIAEIYQQFFPNDKVIVADAHEYLLNNFRNFDFIWSSPPCPTHSRFNLPLFANGKQRYPDMRLYEEIILLSNFHAGKWCVENVISYYDPLIKPAVIDGHYFWTNFYIPNNTKKRDFTNMNIEEIAKERLINLSDLKTKSENYELLLRNAVVPETGKFIFNCAFKGKQELLK